MLARTCAGAVTYAARDLEHACMAWAACIFACQPVIKFACTNNKSRCTICANVCYTVGDKHLFAAPLHAGSFRMPVHIIDNVHLRS
jgi:hypothetical protein